MTLLFPHLHKILYDKEYLRNYDVRHVAEIQHTGLNTFRVLKDKDQYILNSKVKAQFIKWDESWDKISKKNDLYSLNQQNQSLADQRNADAKNALEQIENLLNHTLEIDDTVNFESLKDKSYFLIPNPKNKLNKEIQVINYPTEPKYKDHPPKPNENSFLPKLSLLEKAVKSLGNKKIEEARDKYLKTLAQWERDVDTVDTNNKKSKDQYNSQIKDYNAAVEQIKKKFDVSEKQWEKERDEFYDNQELNNQKVEALKTGYFQKDPDAIIEYNEIVLSNSEYPYYFPKDFELEYNSESKMLVIDYELPAPDDLPKLSEVKYIAAKKELKECYISDLQFAKMYDESIYKITLRTIHEIFEADQVGCIDMVAFNGWVNAINRATGKIVNSCIVSMQVKKTDFLDIDLSRIDPKVCFKNLRGVGSSKLIGITPIQPVIQMDRSDNRFISSYGVADHLDSSTNLAAMPWEDFEHLIREVFEKEFSSNGGEVKVTQSSRDGGVDAVAFDPDPIRGGKIVIQAKRYTNTVGVSAIRDLYGTVMNEGATKGIIVTTSNYGPDAYEFATNKPITLMNGANLLYLLEKHGHKAIIDINAAKSMQAGR